MAPKRHDGLARGQLPECLLHGLDRFLHRQGLNHITGGQKA
jgi:hypothetical protein